MFRNSHSFEYKLSTDGVFIYHILLLSTAHDKKLL